MSEKKIKKIGITGGKGGTGKSTAAILLAGKFLKEGKKVILCDCDVECPNDYLLIGESLNNSVQKIYTSFPKLNKKKCTKCGLCVKACRENAIFQPPGGYPVFMKNLCSGCGACWTVCPVGAIEKRKEEVGEIYLNKIRNSKSEIQNFYLVTGLAKAGLEETGPIVRESKKFSLELAKKEEADIVIFDTAAGTHCPVINALIGVDEALAVTEPTPMGALDLKLILDLCKKLKIPTEIILNQFDLGSKKRIEEIAKKFKIKIRKKIPYSKKIVTAYSKGQLLNVNF